jgi:hypothetical protein
VWAFFIVSYYGRFLGSIEIFFSAFSAAIRKYLKNNFSSRNFKGPDLFLPAKIDPGWGEIQHGLDFGAGTW